MAVMFDHKLDETFLKRCWEGPSTSAVVSLPPKKRKLEPVAVNGGLRARQQNGAINGGLRARQQYGALNGGLRARQQNGAVNGGFRLRQQLGVVNEGFRARQQMGLLPKLLSVGVDRPTWILSKTLAKTDLDLCESRLLLTSKNVGPSPLLGIFTNTEHEAVHDKTGLKLRGFDWLGREYNMIFKFLKCNGAYRVIGEWSRFLRYNGHQMRVGDSIDIWAFRIPKREGGSEIGMAFSHHKQDEELIDERYEENAESCLNEKKETEKITENEWTAAVALLEMKEVFNQD